jgi:hypothetical protein
MAKYYDAIITLKQGVVYYTPKDAIFKVEKIATNSNGPATLWIKETQLGAIKSLIAPLYKTSSNLLGPLDLGNKYYVIPRETAFKFTGDAGSIMVLIGKWIMLDRPDEVPKELTERGLTQFRDYRTYVEAVTSLATDQSLLPDAEVSILSLTPKEIETFTFNGPLMVSVSNYTPAEGELALRFFYDNAYFTNLTDLPGTDRKGGIDIMYCPRPPSATTHMEPFSLAAIPVTVKGPHTFQIFVRNVKGAPITPESETKLTFTVTAIVDYSSESGGK